MNSIGTIKRFAFPILKFLHVDGLFRYLNREKVLILAYHGITKKKYKIQPWLLIPLDSFEQQIRYIARRYNVISLELVAETMASGGHLPRNSAVITFDDGYRNNYTLALPVLKKYGVPATVFVTAGYVGAKNILPLDEAYLTIAYSKKTNPITIPEIGLGPLFFDTEEAVGQSYRKTVSVLKQYPTPEQKRHLHFLKAALGAEYNQKDIISDFLLLSWEEIHALLATGLVQIGAHTVSHEILSNLEPNEAAREISVSKAILQENTGMDIKLFAYPNGMAADFHDEHIRHLQKMGFTCSVTTTPKLNDIHENPYRLGRFCIGPELAANPSHFALKTSGFISALKSLKDNDA